MSATLEIYTIGAGDLIQEVLNAVAAIFNDKAGIASITHLAILFGGICAAFQFTKVKDIKILLQWAGVYVLVTSLVLYPKATVQVVDRTDLKPRLVSNVPLSLATLASITSRLGIGMAEKIESVFHMPQDMAYNKTGMLMGSKLILASQDFQITDAAFSENLNGFMQQCVFYDLLLGKYSIDALMHQSNPWKFIEKNTSQTRAFPLDHTIVICKEGAAELDKRWHDEINRAAGVYGAQLLGKSSLAATTLLSRLSDSYSMLTHASDEGADILQKALLSNALSHAVTHFSASVNAPAALSAFEEAKTDLSIRHTLDITGRQAGYWLQQFHNMMQAILYGAFIFIYFLSYFPFGLSILRNYLFGLLYIETLSLMFAIVNFAVTFYAENRSLIFSGGEGLSLANIGGITQANADAIALAGYLSWVVTIGGTLFLIRGLPHLIQHAGQYIGGVVQNAAGHVAAEGVSGNVSVGNTSFGTKSLFNTNANHFDTNARISSGMLSMQTPSGSTVSITPSGKEILNSQGSLSNLPVSIHVAESVRAAASVQAQTNYSAAYSDMRAAGNQYATAFRNLSDFANQRSHFENSGEGYSESNSTGFSHSASKVSHLIDSFAKEHHVSHERAAQLLGEVYAGVGVKGKITLPLVGEAHAEGGISGRASMSGRSAFGSLYNEAERYSRENHFSEAVDTARRESAEKHFRTSNDAGSRLSQTFVQSLEQGDSYRNEATSHYSRAESYSKLASVSTENSASINANYSQEFYDWLKSKRGSYRHGGGEETMSRSRIDNMSISELQTYADQFTQEKTADLIGSFKSNNHLSEGAQHIQDTYAHHNQQLPNKHHVDQQNTRNEKAIYDKSELMNVEGEIKEHVRSQMMQDEQLRQGYEKGTETRGARVAQHAKGKVDDQIFNSINIIKSSEKKVADLLTKKEENK